MPTKSNVTINKTKIKHIYIKITIIKRNKLKTWEIFDSINATESPNYVQNTTKRTKATLSPKMDQHKSTYTKLINSSIIFLQKFPKNTNNLFQTCKRNTLLNPTILWIFPISNIICKVVMETIYMFHVPYMTILPLVFHSTERCF